MIQTCTSSIDIWNNSSYKIMFYVLVMTRKKVKYNQNSVKKDQEKISVVHYLKLTKTAIQQLILLSVFTINRKYWIIFF